MLDKSSNKSETVEASPLVQEQEAQRKEGIAETTREEVLLLTTYWKIYGAMDIALRVLNNQSSAKLLSLSKGYVSRNHLEIYFTSKPQSLNVGHLFEITQTGQVLSSIFKEPGWRGK
jgi:hypothetical protein